MAIDGREKREAMLFPFRWFDALKELDDAELIVENCVVALKRKEQRFRERAAALGLRFVKHAVSGADRPMYFLKMTGATCYGAETLEELATAFFHLPEAPRG